MPPLEWIEFCDIRLLVADPPAPTPLLPSEMPHGGTKQSGNGLLETFEPDVVLTDLKMPRMTGDELAVRLRSLAPLMPLIVASGYLSEAVEYRLRHDVNGPIEIFTKPINLAGVLRALSTMLSRSTPDH